MFLSGFDRSLCKVSFCHRERFDENENSRARLGSQRSSFLVRIPVLVQQLQQLYRRASLAPRLPHGSSVNTLHTQERARTHTHNGLHTSRAASSLSSQQSVWLHGGRACVTSAKTLVNMVSTKPPAPRRRTVRLPPCPASTLLSSSQSSFSASLLHACSNTTRQQPQTPRKRARTCSS